MDTREQFKAAIEAVTKEIELTRSNPGWGKDEAIEALMDLYRVSLLLIKDLPKTRKRKR